MKMKEPIAYLLMRNDLPSMNPGKAMAQAFHAGNQIAEHWRTISMKGEAVTDYLDAGHRGGAHYFNTCITLAATHDQISKALFAALKRNNCAFGSVIDPTYPFMLDKELIPWVDEKVTVYMDDGHPFGPCVPATRKELTCAWFIGDKQDEAFTSMFAGLNLHP